MKAAFEEALGITVAIPEHYNMMGAIGAALIAKDKVEKTGSTNFKGFDLAESIFS
ncbi:MAG: 2-hydroxyglutaryl-CoA dehydratase, partial [Clostridia bacterium]|nr:2-hydroxyglutaryl-CoA dehydratase [Clostridia bacterium]